MKVESFLSVTLVLSVFSLATGQNVSNIALQCYDCDPANDAEGCINPSNTTTNLPLVTCSNKYPTTEANSSYQCISSYITTNGNSAISTTGIYRGCRLQGASVVDICDWLKQEIENKSATLTSCASCSTTACNNVTFTATGDIVNNGSEMHMAFNLLLITVVSALLHSIC